jgi:hypothetical protein
MSIVSGSLQAWATQSAAETQAEAADRASQVQLQMYQQTRQDLAPWRESGSWATQQLANKIAMGPGGTAARGPESLNTLSRTGTIRADTSGQPSAAIPWYESTPLPGNPRYVSPSGQPGVNALVMTQTPNGTWEYRGNQSPGGGIQLPSNAVIGPTTVSGQTIPEGYWAVIDETGESGQVARNIQPLPAGSVTYQGTPVGMQAGQGLPSWQGGGGGGGQNQNALTSFQTPSVVSDYSQWPSQYQQSPYYNFLVGEGTKALERGAASKGNQFSGAQGKALTTFGQNMALTDYDNWLKNWYQSLTPYQSLAGLGQTAGSQTGAASMQTGSNVAQNTLAGGNAQAAGQMGMGNIGARTSNNLIQNALNYYNANQGAGAKWGAADTGYSTAALYGSQSGAGEAMSAYDYAAMMGY